MTTWLIFFAGLGALLLGAEWLIRGASRLALIWRIPPVIVGLTIVAYGTSAPELAVSLQAAWSGQGEVALGNVIGSNIFNVLFILGLSALIVPLGVDKQLIRLDVPLMIGVSVILYLMSLDGLLSRLDGVMLLSGAGLYTFFLFREGRSEGLPVEIEPPRGRHVWIQLALVLLGLVLLALGSRWLVRAAVTLAEAFGVSPLLIGLTIVAAGTSLPEVVTSVVAALRRARELAVGNVVGSNIFNVLFILGTAAFVAPGGIAIPSSVRDFDLPVMLAVAVACLPVFFTHRRIVRWEGALFLGYYGLYVAYLFLRATGHPGLRDLEAALLGFVLPLTAITLLVLFLGARLRAPS